MPILRMDFTSLRSARIGSGSFGAKTTELDRFKSALESKGIIVPPTISLPVEFFHMPLRRANLLGADGSYLKDAPDFFRLFFTIKIEFNHKQLAVLRSIFGELNGFVVSIRSDEQTAKGIGLYSTEFINLSTASFEDFLGRIKGVLLSQFYPSPFAFVKNLNLVHGIGIQFMPLAGFYNRNNGSIYPIYSIAGFTAAAVGKVLFHLAPGIGAGVAKDASYHSYPNSGHAGCRPNFFRLKRFSVNSHAVEEVHDISNFSLPPPDIVFKSNIFTTLLQIARETGGDFYFELQLVDLNDVWAVTQVAEHSWPKIEIPKGRVLLIFKEEDFVGSGIVHCNRLLTSISQRFRPLAGSLLVSYGFDGLNFHDLAKVGAIVDYSSHAFAFPSHVKGVFREAGIIVLHSSEFQIQQLNSLAENTALTVWADEQNGIAGITVPKK